MTRDAVLLPHSLWAWVWTLARFSELIRFVGASLSSSSALRSSFVLVCCVSSCACIIVGC